MNNIDNAPNKSKFNTKYTTKCPTNDTESILSGDKDSVNLSFQIPSILGDKKERINKYLSYKIDRSEELVMETILKRSNYNFNLKE